MADDKLEKDEARGREAAQLLESPVLQEAFDSVRKTCLDTFATDALDPDQLLRAWLVYRLFLKVESHIKKVLRDGKDASRILEATAKTNQVNGQG